MKKLFLVFIIFISILLFQEKDYIIPSDSIRLRVISNSNSAYDLYMKELIAKKIINIIDYTSVSKDKFKNDIDKNIKSIDDSIKEIFEENEYKENYTIRFGLNSFPEKTYKGVTYKKGFYESLIVEIGEAKGNNYWCVLYPPLCMIDESLNQNNYKSKTIELLNKYFYVNH